jgi:hypothetical protein
MRGQATLIGTKMTHSLSKYAENSIIETQYFNRIKRGESK